MCLTEKNEEREGGQWNEVALSVRWAPCIGFFFEGWLCNFYLREVCVVLFFSSFFRRLFLDTHSVKPDFFLGVQTQPHLLSGPAGQALKAAWKCLDWVWRDGCLSLTPRVCFIVNVNAKREVPLLLQYSLALIRDLIHKLPVNSIWWTEGGFPFFFRLSIQLCLVHYPCFFIRYLVPLFPTKMCKTSSGHVRYMTWVCECMYIYICCVCVCVCVNGSIWNVLPYIGAYTELLPVLSVITVDHFQPNTEVSVPLHLQSNLRPLSHSDGYVSKTHGRWFDFHVI